VFQSSPTPKRGRYRPDARNAAAKACFNPRPRRSAGATHSMPPRMACPRWFQSSPTPKRGRYGTVEDGKLVLDMFQSSPTPKRGRYLDRAFDSMCETSFNPRPRRSAGATPSNGDRSTVTLGFNPRPRRSAGATRLRPAGMDDLSRSFNPRPRRSAGATSSLSCAMARPSCVSILAHAEARALPDSIA